MVRNRNTGNKGSGVKNLTDIVSELRTLGSRRQDIVHSLQADLLVIKQTGGSMSAHRIPKEIIEYISHKKRNTVGPFNDEVGNREYA